MQAQTSTQDDEIIKCLAILKASNAGTGFMHESFNMDNFSDYTRSWFAWYVFLLFSIKYKLITSQGKFTIWRININTGCYEAILNI